MANFSDFLAQELPGGDDDREFSGPHPGKMLDVDIVDMFTRVDGEKRTPDEKLAPEEVEELVQRLKLRPSEIRGERLLRNSDAATFLGISISTLAEWRNLNVNLPYYVTPVQGLGGRRIFYRLADLIRYREYVYSHFTPDNVTMPPPGMMGTPLT